MRKQELHPRTAALNKVQKNKSKKARLDALLWLAATFPKAFDNTLRICPLKTGIIDDIMQYAHDAEQVGISKSKLREAVVLFTRRLDYLACLKAREMRIDLQGNMVDAVTEIEAEHAAAKIKKRVEKSARNARKLLLNKTSEKELNIPHPSMIKSTAVASDQYLPTYPPRAPVYTSQTAQPVRTAAVTIKHKTPKQYDPSAIARLKEKLGLSRSAEDKKETVE